MNETTQQYIAMKGIVVGPDDKILIVREATTYEDATRLGKYMLPGGRIDTGENHLVGLKREIKEETGLDIEPIRPVFTKEWSPTIAGVKSQIVAIFYLCKPINNDVVLSEEHDEYRWISEEELAGFDGEFIDNDVTDGYFRQLEK